MAKIGDVSMTFTLDGMTSVITGVDKIKAKLNELGKPIPQKQGGIGGLLNTVKANFLPIAAVATGVVVAFKAVSAAMGEMSNLAAIQVRAEKQLGAVLNSTKMAAGLTAVEVKKMASSFQESTNFGDEAVLSAQNMLLTFTNIKKDAFEPTTEAVLNMATAMNNGMTPSAEALKATAIQVGKALQDPIRGATALRRVGVALTEQQEKQIKTFVEMGDVASAQKIILNELGTEFGGLAKAMASPKTQLINVIGDIKETFGMLFNSFATAIAKDILPIAKKIEAWLYKNRTDIIIFGKTAWDAIKIIITPLTTVIGLFIKLPNQLKIIIGFILAYVVAQKALTSAKLIATLAEMGWVKALLSSNMALRIKETGAYFKQMKTQGVSSYTALNKSVELSTGGVKGMVGGVGGLVKSLGPQMLVAAIAFAVTQLVKLGAAMWEAHKATKAAQEANDKYVKALQKSSAGKSYLAKLSMALGDLQIMASRSAGKEWEAAKQRLDDVQIYVNSKVEAEKLIADVVAWRAEQAQKAIDKVSAREKEADDKKKGLLREYIALKVKEALATEGEKFGVQRLLETFQNFNTDFIESLDEFDNIDIAEAIWKATKGAGKKAGEQFVSELTDFFMSADAWKLAGTAARNQMNLQINKGGKQDVKQLGLTPVQPKNPFQLNLGKPNMIVGKDAPIDPEKIKESLQKVGEGLTGVFMSIVDGSQTAAQAFKGLMKSITLEAVKLLAQKVIQKLITFLFPPAAGAKAAGGVLGFLGQLFENGGIAGRVAYAANGLVSKGRDTIPAMLRPREMVLTPEMQQGLFDMLAGRGNLAGAGGGGANIYIGNYLGTEREFTRRAAHEIDKASYKRQINKIG
jgi:hypothetical protein